MHIGQLKSHFRSACCALNFGANDFKKLRSLLKNEDESTMVSKSNTVYTIVTVCFVAGLKAFYNISDFKN